MCVFSYLLKIADFVKKNCIFGAKKRNFDAIWTFFFNSVSNPRISYLYYECAGGHYLMWKHENKFFAILKRILHFFERFCSFWCIFSTNLLRECEPFWFLKFAISFQPTTKFVKIWTFGANFEASTTFFAKPFRSRFFQEHGCDISPGAIFKNDP